MLDQLFLSDLLFLYRRNTKCKFFKPNTWLYVGCSKKYTL